MDAPKWKARTIVLEKEASRLRLFCSNRADIEDMLGPPGGNCKVGMIRGILASMVYDGQVAYLPVSPGVEALFDDPGSAYAEQALKELKDEGGQGLKSCNFQNTPSSGPVIKVGGTPEAIRAVRTGLKRLEEKAKMRQKGGFILLFLVI